MKTRLLLLLALLAATPAFGYLIKETKASEPFTISTNTTVYGQNDMFKVFADGTIQLSVLDRASTIVNSTFQPGFYLRDNNGTNGAGVVTPEFVGFTNDSTSTVNFSGKIGSTTDSGSNAALTFRVSKVDGAGTSSAIATRPAFDWSNFGTDLMQVSAGGTLQVATITNLAGTGQPAFSQGLSVATAKNISGGATTAIISGNGTATSPSFAFQADSTTGFARSNSNTIDFITGGTNAGNIVSTAWTVGPTAGGVTHTVYGRDANGGATTVSNGSIRVQSSSSAGYQLLALGTDATGSYSYIQAYNNSSTNGSLRFYGGSGSGVFVGGYSAGGIWSLGSTTYTNTPHIANGVIAQATTGTVGGAQTNVGTAVFSLNSGSGVGSVTGLLTVPNLTSGNNPLNMQCTVTSTPWGAGSTGSWNCVWVGTSSNPWTCSAACTAISGSGTAPTPTTTCNTGSGASFGLTSGQTFSLISMNCVAAAGGAPITWKTTANN